MPVEKIDNDQLKAVSKSLNINLSQDKITEYKELVNETLQAYDLVDELENFLPVSKYPRDKGRPPSDSENPNNAWYWLTDIKGSREGVLKGKSVAFKDNIMVQDVPMMNGSSTLEGFVPEVDATVVKNVLDAGGVIKGKASCEYFCTSGGSHTNAKGPVHNPIRRGYSSGGSSSGCGSLIASGDVDLAVGTDHGGSCRIPASFCGIVGMKATYGLVSCDGIMPIETTVDYVGPMSKTVKDCALLLEVLIQEDQDSGSIPKITKGEAYLSNLKNGCKNLKIGVLKEGFNFECSEPAVDEAVLEAADQFKKMGAIVEPISIPTHRFATAIWTPIYLEGLVCSSMQGNGYGKNAEGYFSPSLINAHRNWRTLTDGFGPQTELIMLVGEYITQKYNSYFYAKSQNLRRLLRRDYEIKFKDYDLSLMPTLPMVATELPKQDAKASEIVSKSLEMAVNTPAADLTGHPSISIPCGHSDGLPIGLMLTGRFFEESKLLTAAYAFENK